MEKESNVLAKPKCNVTYCLSVPILESIDSCLPFMSWTSVIILDISSEPILKSSCLIFDTCRRTQWKRQRYGLRSVRVCDWRSLSWPVSEPTHSGKHVLTVWFPPRAGHLDRAGEETINRKVASMEHQSDARLSAPEPLSLFHTSPAGFLSDLLIIAIGHWANGTLGFKVARGNPA